MPGDAVRWSSWDGMMVHDEAARHGLYDALTTAIGPDSTSVLMSLLPPTGWADVATKQDLAQLRTDMSAEVSGVRTEVEVLRGEVRSDIATLRGEVRTDIANVRTDFERLRGEFADLRTDVAVSQRQQTLTLVGAMLSIATLTTIAGALI